MGYEICKKRLFKLRFKVDNVVGVYFVTFARKAMFICKASQVCTGFQIRKQHWLQVLEDNPEIAKPIKIRILEDFFKKIRKPMMMHKKRDIRNLKSSNQKNKQNIHTLYKDVELTHDDFYRILIAINQP